MKKIISVITLIAVLMGVFAVCALADAKADIVAKAEEVCPDGYEDQYMPALNNILAQIQVTDEQAAIVNACMETASPIVNSGKGTRLADYTQAEKDTVLGELKKGCDAVGVGYKIVEGEKATTVEFYVKDAKDASGRALEPGTVLGSISIDTTPVTTGVSTTMVLVAAAAALVVLASAAFVAQKTRA